MYSLSNLLEAITLVFPGSIIFSDLGGKTDFLRVTWKGSSFRIRVSTCSVEEYSDGLLKYGSSAVLIENVLRNILYLNSRQRVPCKMCKGLSKEDVAPPTWFFCPYCGRQFLPRGEKK